MEEQKEWFQTWFDSPYYHYLYEQRDEKEASAFLQALSRKINIPSNARILDAACGSGRLAGQLQSLGLQVDGFDLSPSNIAEAQQKYGHAGRFFQHDMRLPLAESQAYDAIFNFFTSFGYFEQSDDNQRAFYAFHQALKRKGLLVLDFFNPSYVLAHLVPEERVLRRGIAFHIKRWEAQGYLYKSIAFEDQGQAHYFEERVELISKNDFIHYAAQAGFQFVDLLGDYKLGYFDEKNSPRMIFFWAK